MNMTYIGNKYTLNVDYTFMHVNLSFGLCGLSCGPHTHYRTLSAVHCTRVQTTDRSAAGELHLDGKGGFCPAWMALICSSGRAPATITRANPESWDRLLVSTCRQVVVRPSYVSLGRYCMESDQAALWQDSGAPAGIFMLPCSLPIAHCRIGSRVAEQCLEQQV